VFVKPVSGKIVLFIEALAFLSFFKLPRGYDYLVGCICDGGWEGNSFSMVLYYFGCPTGTFFC